MLRAGHDPHNRNAAWPLRDCRPARSRRHGRGVSRPRHAAGSGGRDQDYQRRLHRALRAGSPGDLGPQSPAHLHALRRRFARGWRLSRDGAGRGATAPRPDPLGRRRAPRGRRVRCARRRASAAHRSPGSQTRQRAPDPERREGDRLRPRQAGVRQRNHRRTRHDAGNAHRNHRLHGAGTGPGETGRRKVRPVGGRHAASSC
jgi:hypothetical protein